MRTRTPNEPERQWESGDRVSLLFQPKRGTTAQELGSQMLGAPWENQDVSEPGRSVLTCVFLEYSLMHRVDHTDGGKSLEVEGRIRSWVGNQDVLGALKV